MPVSNRCIVFRAPWCVLFLLLLCPITPIHISNRYNTPACLHVHVPQKLWLGEDESLPAIVARLSSEYRDLLGPLLRLLVCMYACDIKIFGCSRLMEGGLASGGGGGSILCRAN